MSKMDVLEDTLVSNEVNGANALVAHYTQAAQQPRPHRRHHSFSYIEQNTQEIDARRGMVRDD
jgi:hypothetical protein